MAHANEGGWGLGDAARVVEAVVSAFKHQHVACCEPPVEDGLGLDSEGVAKLWPRGGWLQRLHRSNTTGVYL